MTLGMELHPDHACPDCRDRYGLWWKGFVQRYSLKNPRPDLQEPRPLACTACVDAEQARRFVARAQGAIR